MFEILLDDLVKLQSLMCSLEAANVDSGVDIQVGPEGNKTTVCVSRSSVTPSAEEDLDA